MFYFLLAFEFRLVTLQCFFLAYKKVDSRLIVFRFLHMQALRIKKNMPSSAMIGSNSPFEEP